MATTQVVYTGDGSTVLFSFTFPYILGSHVKASLDGVETTDFSLANATTIEFDTAPANGVQIIIYRKTDVESPAATFYAGSSIRASSLNNNFVQALYTLQEGVGQGLSRLGGAMLGVLSMGGFRLTTLGTPVDATDAATKGYVDTTAVSVTGDTMSGDLDMDGNKVTGLGTPSVDTDSATKLYVDQRYGELGVPGLTRWREIATAGQTVFSGVGEDGNTLAYSASRESVFVNGAYQQRGVDYTADNGTSITITPALLLGDVVDVHCVNNAAGVATDQASGVYFTQSGSGALARTVDSKLKDVVSVKDFGAVGDGVTFDTAAIKAAIDYGIANGKAVYVPSGTYLCTYNVLLFTFSTSVSKTFTLFGDGATSILKMGDGLITASNRRLFDMRPAIDMDLIEIHDLVFDNNARGSTPPPSPFDYEQSHTIRFAGATGTTTKLLRYHNVTVKDPVADGMNNQDVGIIQNWVISNCSEIDRTRVRSSIQQSHMAENLVITGFSGQRIESEPVANLTTEKTVLISNSRLEILDMAGRGDNSLAKYFISNTTVSQDMNVSRCILSISNSNIKIGTTGTGRFNYLAVGSQISDTTLRLNYNSTTGVVTGVDLYGNTADSGPHSCTFDNVNFLIDYVGTLPVAATGFLVKGSLSCPAAQIEDWQWTIRNSYFDPRAAGSVNCYRNGVWTLENNTYACAALTVSIAAVFHTHGSPTNGSRVTVNGGDFRNVVGYGIAVSNIAGTSQEISSLTLLGTMLGDAACNMTKFGGGTVSANDAYLNNSREVQVASLPTYALNSDTVVIRAGNTALGTGVEYAATATSQTVPAFRLTRQKGVKQGTTANRPTASANDIGLLYLDTTLDADGKPIWYNGTAWVDATGAVV
jgi:hypothetical protein